MVSEPLEFRRLPTTKSGPTPLVINFIYNSDINIIYWTYSGISDKSWRQGKHGKYDGGYYPMSKSLKPEFKVVDTAALNQVAKMPDNYAAMSHFEFFAEMYALYYDYDDPKRKVIPTTVTKWFDDNIGKCDPKNPRRLMARQSPGLRAGNWDRVVRVRSYISPNILNFKLQRNYL